MLSLRWPECRHRVQPLWESPVDLTFLTPLAKKAADTAASKLIQRGLDWLGDQFKCQAFRESAERAFSKWLDSVWHLMRAVGAREFAIAEYRAAAEKLLEDEQVVEELLRPLLDPNDASSPDIAVLVPAWNRASTQPLPDDFPWVVAWQTYRKACRSEQIATPELRERLDTQSLLDIKAALRGLVGVRPATDLVRYARRVAEKFDPIAMEAAIDPSRMRELGHRVTLANVFVPQDVRHNPPAVELPRELLKRIADKNARLSDENDENDGDDEADQRRWQEVRLHFQQQPRRNVLEVLCQSGASRLVLIGDPGAGKSALTRYVLLSVLRRRGWLPEGQIPAWTEPLREHFPTGADYFVGGREAALPTAVRLADQAPIMERLGMSEEILLATV